jgi:hypothetical protein
MYDPMFDEEEKHRKIANEQMLQSLQAPAMDIQPQVAPPTAPDVESFMEQMRPYLSNMGQTAQTMQSQGFMSPGIDPVHRGGGALQPSSIPMAGYGQGLVGQMGQQKSDGDKKSDMAKMIMKMMGGG